MSCIHHILLHICSQECMQVFCPAIVQSYASANGLLTWLTAVHLIFIPTSKPCHALCCPFFTWYRQACSLTSINLSNNRLEGSLPESLSIFAKPDFVINLQGNYLSCCGQQHLGGGVYAAYNMNAPLLPSFITFSDLYVQQPVTDGANSSIYGLK